MSQPSDSRVPLLAVADAADAAAAQGMPASFSELNVFRVLLQHPRLAGSIRSVFAAIREGTLDAGVRELVILRIAWQTGAEYEWSHHWRIARGDGADKEDLAAVRVWRDHAGFGARQRAALALTDETLETGSVTDSTWAACVEEFPTVDERLELLATIGIYGMMAQLIRTLQVPLEDAVRSWPPDGHGPQ